MTYTKRVRKGVTKFWAIMLIVADSFWIGEYFPNSFDVHRSKKSLFSSNEKFIYIFWVLTATLIP